MATENPSEQFPPADALPRAVLVRNVSPLATSATIEDFFSFCGPIETHRLRTLPGSSDAQQAVVIFSDERARDNALVMDQSSIVDRLVKITPVPNSFDFNEQPTQASASLQQPTGFLGSGFSAFGDLFAGVGTVVAAEVEKASKVIDKATDTGVLKTAKDQMALARKRTTDFAADLDHKWHVRENVRSAAEVSKEQATAVASVVATSTSSLATQVDRSLHISENTGKLAEKARENPTVNSGIRAVTGGFQTLLAQTGLHANNDQTANSNAVNPQTPAAGQEASQTPQQEVNGTSQNTPQ